MLLLSCGKFGSPVVPRNDDPSSIDFDSV